MNLMTDSQQIQAIVAHPNSEFTIRSKKTGTHCTYKVWRGTRQDALFVSYLAGPDNTHDWSYLGRITEQLSLHQTKNSPSRDTRCYSALDWFLRVLQNNETVSDFPVEFYHSGKCRRCGRKLTTPESITLGIGPKCATKE